MSNDIHEEEENLNPPMAETKHGALYVPENSLKKKTNRKLKPILKFDDFGNEIEDYGTD